MFIILPFQILMIFFLIFNLSFQPIAAAEEFLSSNKSDHENFRHFRKSPGKGMFLGSAQMTSKNLLLLPKLIDQVAKNIIIINLRMESTIIINDIPYTWKSNGGDSVRAIGEIELDETNRLNHLVKAGVALIPNNKSKSIDKVTLISATLEKHIVEELGYHYVRLPILDHSNPEDHIVDEFMAILKNNPNSSILFHCHVGKGRTTLALVMADCYFSAKEISFDEILNRQKRAGGEDFFKHEIKPIKNQDPHRYELAIKRLQFLRNYYRYCQEADFEKISWSEWSKDIVSNTTLRRGDSEII